MEQRNNDVLRTLYILRLQGSVISVSENVIFYLQRRNSGPVNWRKQRFLSYEAMLWWESREKKMGYNSEWPPTDKWQKAEKYNNTRLI